MLELPSTFIDNQTRAGTLGNVQRQNHQQIGVGCFSEGRKKCIMKGRDIFIDNCFKLNFSTALLHEQSPLTRVLTILV